MNDDEPRPPVVLLEERRWAPISPIERRLDHLDTYTPRPVAWLEREAS